MQQGENALRRRVHSHVQLRLPASGCVGASLRRQRRQRRLESAGEQSALRRRHPAADHVSSQRDPSDRAQRELRQRLLVAAVGQRQFRLRPRSGQPSGRHRAAHEIPHRDVVGHVRGSRSQGQQGPVHFLRHRPRRRVSDGRPVRVAANLSNARSRRRHPMGQAHFQR